MSDTFKIKPTDPSVTVRDPETRRPLANKGESKPRNPYWIRRLNDGDVEIVQVKSGGKSS